MNSVRRLSRAMADLASSETFIHELGVLISRSLNTLNPNPVLAARVFQLAATLGSLPAFATALSSFGKFSQAHAAELWDRCQTQATINDAFTVPGLTVTDSDTLAPDQPGGRPGLSTAGDKHVFKAPAVPRTSTLGLDRLAMEKRKQREDEDEGGHFKSTSSDRSEPALTPAVPSKIAPSHPRNRAQDTPSHPGGLSDKARKSLEEHRAKKSRLESTAANSRNERDRDEGGRKAMDGFRERLNKNENGRGDRGRKDWDEEGRPRDGGWNRERMGNSQGGETPRRDTRDRASTVTDTPSSSDPTSSRIKHQSWDSTPSGSRGAPPVRRPESWDSTPRSVRGTPARSERGSGEWDTPRRVPSGYGDESPGPLPPPSSGLDEKEWEAQQTKLDREWYNIDEMGGEASEAEFGGYDDYDKEKEEELLRKAGGPKKRVTARQAAYNADNEVWEENRLALSGVTGQRRKLDFDALDDEEETRVHLLVHDLKPPFLDGRLSFTKQLDPINPIKDPSSDLAVFAKKGSRLVMERRAAKEREKVSPSSTAFDR